MLLNVDVLLIYPVVIFLVRGFYLSASACVSDVCIGSTTFLGRRNNSTKVGWRELDGVRGVISLLSKCLQGVFGNGLSFLILSVSHLA